MKTQSRATTTPPRRALTAVAVALLLTSCGESAPTVVQPVTMAAGAVCSLDGMLLMDFPGPKAQIHYERGEPEFFCDTMEMFSMYLRPEQSRRVLALYTQDMGKTPWDKPVGNWIDARTAFYVVGSDRKGSMGPTLAAFAQESAAHDFVSKHGGETLRFDQVTLDRVTVGGGRPDDEKM